MARRLGLRRRAVERWDHLGGAVRQRGDDAGGGEEDVEHDHRLAGQALGVELLLFQQDVDLHFLWLRRCIMP
jgi:hypothetical protein